MPLNPHKPILYLITSGETTEATTPFSLEFQNILALVRASLEAGISLIQLREKNLSARTLYELTVSCAGLTRGSETRLLVNDRADIARAAGADGVHLTTRSIETSIIRRTFGASFLIGVSTHTLHEARSARDQGADFAVFGPVFETPSKSSYGSPVGLESLHEAAHLLSPFPLLALGGITTENAARAIGAGASGVAAIRLFGNQRDLSEIVRRIRNEAAVAS
jgi:thiamine-phosphate pyrophosphorylase